MVFRVGIVFARSSIFMVCIVSVVSLVRCVMIV